MAVALIMVKVWKIALEFARRPISASNLRQLEVGAAVQIGRPADIIADEQIELAIIVIIEPGSACAPTVAGAADSGSLGDVTKLAVPFISEQMVSSNACDENIHQAVVIKIACSNP